MFFSSPFPELINTMPVLWPMMCIKDDFIAQKGQFHTWLHNFLLCS